MIEAKFIEQAIVFLHTAVELDREMPGDSLVLVRMFETEREYKATVGIGLRAKMRQALIDEGVLVDRAKGFVWCVIDWGEEVSTLLYSRPDTACRSAVH